MTIRPSLKATIVAGAALGALATTALAADIIEPTIIEAPVIEKVKPFAGWYIRGDVGYAFVRERDGVQIEDALGAPKVIGNQPATLLPFETEYDDGYTLGIGVGGHLGQYLRADVTADYLTESAVALSQAADPLCGAACSSTTYAADMNAILVMANAYVDAGTYAGITPYVGAGIGFAHVDYDDVVVSETDPITGAPLSFVYDSESTLRLAWSLSAGASYDINDQVAVDAGYRFTRVEDDVIAVIEGAKFKDDGLDLHQVRLGARVKLH